MEPSLWCDSAPWAVPLSTLCTDGYRDKVYRIRKETSLVWSITSSRRMINGAILLTVFIATYLSTEERDKIGYLGPSWRPHLQIMDVQPAIGRDHRSAPANAHPVPAAHSLDIIRMSTLVLECNKTLCMNASANVPKHTHQRAWSPCGPTRC
jgi:hypothetical protein